MRKLIAYFSASGTTRRAAIALSLITEADLFEIAPAVPYTAKDLDWNDKRSRSSMEMKDESSRPALREAKVDLSGYDMIYIGFPIWWGVAPRAVNTFIESNDLKGLRIVIFATSGGSGLPYAVEDLRKKYPDLDITSGRLLNGAVTEDII